MRPLFRPAAVDARRGPWLGRVQALRPAAPPLAGPPGAAAPARRLPLMLQTEGAECALACLAMIACAHGLDTDLAAMRSRFPASLKGVTLADVVRMADALHLHARPLRAELDELDRLRTPCLLHWDLDHFVVLASLRRGVAVIHDPARGVRRMTLAQLSPHVTGVALELTPGPKFVPRRERTRLRARDLLGPVDGLRSALARIFALALALEGFVLLSPFFLQWVVDDVLRGADPGLLPTLAIGFALLVGVQAATATARAWAVLALSSSLGQQWLSSVHAHLLRLPLPWFEKRHAGDIWSRFASVQQIQNVLTTSFVEAVLDGLMVVVTFGVMLSYSGLLAAIAAAAVLAYALLRLALLRPLREATAESLSRESRQASHFLESLRGMQSIRLADGAADRRARFSSLVAETIEATVATRRLELVCAIGQRLLFGLERVAVVGVGAALVLDQRVSLGMLFAFLAWREQFALRVATLIDKAVALGMLRLQAERLADIVTTPPEADGRDRPAPATPIEPSIELIGVGFRYADGEPDVLHDVTLRIGAGESVAIAGPSGSGKSTLLKIILGLYTPTRGEVRIGGVPLATLGLARWRTMAAAVMQDEALFAGSIADNIAFCDPSPDRGRIERCARQAALHDEIVAMPMGYATLLGDLGSALSGGQRQRVLLARALYRQPRVLVLDEATSALDVDSERAVNRAVQALQLTRVVVAHRPETVAAASRVVTLDGGRVARDVHRAAA